MASDEGKPTLGTAVPNDSEEFEELKTDVQVVQWLKDNIDAEVQRIKDAGANAIPISVSNMCIVRDGKTIINRVEIDTKFDFSKVERILISDSIPCPLKKGYSYVNVLLFTKAPIPLVFPYLYLKETKNKLQEWVFINADKIRVRHHVDKFE